MKKSILIYIYVLVASFNVYSIQEIEPVHLNQGSPIVTGKIDEALLIPINEDIFVFLYTKDGTLAAKKSLDACNSFQDISIDLSGLQIQDIKKLEKYKLLDNEWIVLFLGNNGSYDNLYCLKNDLDGELHLLINEAINSNEYLGDISDVQFSLNMNKSFLVTYEQNEKLYYFYYNDFEGIYTTDKLIPDGSSLYSYEVSIFFSENNLNYYIAVNYYDSYLENTLRLFQIIEGEVVRNVVLTTVAAPDTIGDFKLYNNIEDSLNIALITSGNLNILEYNSLNDILLTVSQTPVNTIENEFILSYKPAMMVLSMVGSDGVSKNFYYDILSQLEHGVLTPLNDNSLITSPFQFSGNPDRLTFFMTVDSAGEKNIICKSSFDSGETWSIDDSFYNSNMKIISFFTASWGNLPYFTAYMELNETSYLSLNKFNYTNKVFENVLMETISNPEDLQYISDIGIQCNVIDKNLIEIEMPSGKYLLNFETNSPFFLDDSSVSILLSENNQCFFTNEIDESTYIACSIISGE